MGLVTLQNPPRTNSHSTIWTLRGVSAPWGGSAWLVSPVPGPCGLSLPHTGLLVGSEVVLFLAMHRAVLNCCGLLSDQFPTGILPASIGLFSSREVGKVSLRPFPSPSSSFVSLWEAGWG